MLYRGNLASASHLAGSRGCWGKAGAFLNSPSRVLSGKGDEGWLVSVMHWWDVLGHPKNTGRWVYADRDRSTQHFQQQITSQLPSPAMEYRYIKGCTMLLGFHERL
jgi:hypothetical protein